MSKKTVDINVKFGMQVPKVLEDGSQDIEMQIVEKVLTLEELDQYAESQHLIHFSLQGLFYTGQDGEFKVKSEELFGLTKLVLNTMFVETPSFTKADLNNLKKDGFAIAAFGNEYFSNYISPFFSKSIALRK